MLEKIKAYSVKEIATEGDLHEISMYCGKGFSMNDRVCIYLGWFKEDAKQKLLEGYNVSILELPAISGEAKVETIEFLDEILGDDLIVLGKVDV